MKGWGWGRDVSATTLPNYLCENWTLRQKLKNYLTGNYWSTTQNRVQNISPEETWIGLKSGSLHVPLRFFWVSKQLLPSPATAWTFRTPKLTPNELKHLAGSRGWPAGFPFRPIRTADPHAFAQSGNGPPGSHFVEKPMENHRMRKLWKWAAGDAFRWKTNGKSSKLQAGISTTITKFQWKTVSKSTKWVKQEKEHKGRISMKTITKSTKFAKSLDGAVRSGFRRNHLGN